MRAGAAHGLTNVSVVGSKCWGLRVVACSADHRTTKHRCTCFYHVLWQHQGQGRSVTLPSYTVDASGVDVGAQHTDTIHLWYSSLN